MTTQTWAPPKQRIVGPLRSRINQLAHSLAQAEEVRLAGVLTRQLQTAADEGASAAQLHDMLKKLEDARQPA
jgi:hypothetical protein